MEVMGSGELLGSQVTLKQKYSLIVRKDDVISIMGIENYSTQIFQRAYQSMGSNEVWHVDGQGKLKPF